METGDHLERNGFEIRVRHVELMAERFEDVDGAVAFVRRAKLRTRQTFHQVERPGRRAFHWFDDALQAAGDAQVDTGAALYIGCVRDDHAVSIENPIGIDKSL